MYFSLYVLPNLASGSLSLSSDVCRWKGAGNPLPPPRTRNREESVCLGDEGRDTEKPSREAQVTGLPATGWCRGTQETPTPPLTAILAVGDMPHGHRCGEPRASRRVLSLLQSRGELWKSLGSWPLGAQLTSAPWLSTPQQERNPEGISCLSDEWLAPILATWKSSISRFEISVCL